MAAQVDFSYARLNATGPKVVDISWEIIKATAPAIPTSACVLLSWAVLKASSPVAGTMTRYAARGGVWRPMNVYRAHLGTWT